MSEEKIRSANFIRNIITEEKASGKLKAKVMTRFPPEPNGYLHLGHAKSICLNFGMAGEFSGQCNLRFDDTNPEKEEMEYINSIQEDVKWLGFDWGEHLFYASDYYGQLYQWAEELIQKGLAYVCDLSAEDMRQYRGTLTEPGRESPYRNRSVEENLDLFRRMRAGEFAEGEKSLRAKIDMSSGNVNMRDPVMYRVKKAHHPRTGDDWCIYPMYDFAHGLSDAIEGITHSLCTLEFQDHRPLYDWFIENLDTVPCHPQQIEFARLGLNYTVMSKRKLKELVDTKMVSGWNDPRMPTISGIRRRGYSPAGIRNFCERIGISKKEGVIDMSLLEDEIRADLNDNALRAMAVLDPLKIVISNYPEAKHEFLSAPNHPQKEELGRRELPFSRQLYIEREDFMEEAPKKFFRLSPGQEVRLRYAYVIKCEEVIKDSEGNICELRCTYDPETLGKNPEGRKVKGIIHWVDANQAAELEVRVYDRLFTVENPSGDKEQDYKSFFNQDSLKVIAKAQCEPSLKAARSGDTFQFERLGYFCVDNQDSQLDQPIFNRTVTLRDTWEKEKGK